MKLATVTLENAFVRLRPFDEAKDAQELYALNARAPEIFKLWSHWAPGDWVTEWIEVIRKRTIDGTMIPFIVTRPADGAFLGITSWLDPSEANKTVEVGMTCYAPEAQGTAVNPACKRLLMGHLFEVWGAQRVQYQVDERNMRSRTAVLKLGAVQEGILRNHKIVGNGHVRNTVFFSIIDSEWPAVRDRLDARLAQHEAPG